jgi:hypothetical protein
MIRIHHRSQPAITWHGVEVVNDVVRPGGLLEVIYSLTVHKQCPADLRGFIVAPDGSVPIRLPTLAGGYAQPSESIVKVRVKLPVPLQSDPGLAPLQSGQHTYRTIATRYCPEGVEQDNNIPDATFSLEVDP